MHSYLPVAAKAVSDIEEAVSPAPLVITTTPSRNPLLERRNLHFRLHITALGSDAKGKRELSDDLLRHVDLYAADDLEQCRTYGELQTLPESEVPCVATLADIVAGRVRGRMSKDQTTVADLTGVGVLDTAIAISAFRRLIPAGPS